MVEYDKKYCSITEQRDEKKKRGVKGEEEEEEEGEEEFYLDTLSSISILFSSISILFEHSRTRKSLFNIETQERLNQQKNTLKISVQKLKDLTKNGQRIDSLEV